MSSQCRGGSLLTFILLLSSSFVRAQTAPARTQADEPRIAVTHGDERDDWYVAETANFRLFHRHSRALAESVLRTAEQTRTAQMRKWFGRVGDNWRPKCSLYLYPNGHAYAEATGAPVQPGGGHTDIQAEGGRVLSRRIHIHGTRGFLLKGVVPHEVTHAVLAGRLGRERVPRWADEGMAILAETQSHIDVHFRQLPHWRAQEELFSTRGLIEMRDYPERRSLGVFYAQSVSLVDFLSRQKGAECFADFVRDGVREGYAASLRKHYDWSFVELDRRWRRYAFYSGKAAETMTTGGGG
jgi:hypothetical protein